MKHDFEKWQEQLEHESWTQFNRSFEDLDDWQRDALRQFEYITDHHKPSTLYQKEEKMVKIMDTGSIVRLARQAAEDASIDQGQWRVSDAFQDSVDLGEIAYSCEKLDGQLKGRQAEWLHHELELVTQGPCPCLNPPSP